MAPADNLDRLMERAEELGDRIWEAALVLGIAVFMLVTRLKPYDSFNQGDNAWFFGTDAYYHARHVLYTTANFPQTLGFDAMTQYPLGTGAGQFGTLFDQLAAGLAWIAGLFVDGGAPTTETMLDVLTAYPAILGAFAVVPIYLLVRDLYGTVPGAFAAVAAALLPGSFLLRTTAGFPDHHALEIVLSTTAVWASYRSFRAWEAEDLELDTIARDPLRLYNNHRAALGTSLLAALAFWAYLAAWPPAVLFVGIVALWLVLQTVVEVIQGEDPVDLIVTGATMFTFVSVLILPHSLANAASGFSALTFSWMQPIAPLLVALALLTLAGLAVLWREQDLPAIGYPVAAVAAGLAGLGLLWVLLPTLVEQTISGTSWVTGIGVDPTRRTISEAQPAEFAQLGSQFGWLYISAAIGFIVAIISVAAGSQRRTNMLVLVWATLATSGTFTQSRFLYYLAVAVLVLNGYLASRLLDAADVFAEESSQSDEQDEPIEWSGAHTLVVIALAMMLFPTNVSGFFADCGENTNAWTSAECFPGPGDSRLWAQELDWVEENTPQPPIGLNSSFDRPEGQRYVYPDGMYGVLSWWDYGHQILFDAHRAPVANPFQQQAPLASEIFTADTEEQALSLLDEYLGEENNARYLMIDDEMVSTKFGAITVWATVDHIYHEGVSREYEIEGADRPIPLRAAGEEVRGWFLQDVYFNDGSGMNHMRLVKEHPQFSLIGSRAQIADGQIRVGAYNVYLARNDWDSLSQFDREQAYRVGQNTVIYDAEAGSRLKTYERVPGAHLVGQADGAGPVEVRLDLHASSSGRSFTYELSEELGPEGRFNVTVPYPTHQPLDPAEGGTAATVEAQGPYTLTVDGREANVHVSERAVLEGEQIAVSFDG